MSNYREIVIQWSKRVEAKIENLREFSIERKNVLYQIYGDHHIYGRDTLLYIGISKHCDHRLKQHLKGGVFGYANNLTITIGEIEDFNESLEIPESILIANHKPSFNREFIHDISPKAKENKIIIINNGKNMMLKTCCTNFWWVDHLLKEKSTVEDIKAEMI